jgi:hypothetical protein
VSTAQTKSAPTTWKVHYIVSSLANSVACAKWCPTTKSAADLDGL